MSKATKGVMNKMGLILWFLASSIYFSLFVILYKPFGLQFSSFEIVLYSACISGIIAFISSFLTFIAVRHIENKLFITFNLYWKSILISFFVICISSFAIFSFLSLANTVVAAFGDVLSEIMVASALPFLGALFFTQRVELRNLQITADLLSKQVTDVDKALQDKLLQIKVESSSDSFEFLLSQLLLIEASDNYCTFYLLVNDTVQKSMQRVSLKSVSEQLSNEEEVIRCHRSYMVNLNYFQKIQGNAKGYRMKLLHLDFEVPVSRNTEKSLLNELKKKSKKI